MSPSTVAQDFAKDAKQMAHSPDSTELLYPAAIDLPPEHKLVLSVKAQGVQIYQCRADQDSGKLAWFLLAPEANLFDQDGRKIGKHFAGPTWELNDGSKIIGQLRAKADAPDKQGIPWLLLDAQQGSVRFATVKFIQRGHTNGGIAPSTVGSEKVGAEMRIPYTADYKFLE